MNLLKRIASISALCSLIIVSSSANDDLVKKGEKIFMTNTKGNFWLVMLQMEKRLMDQVIWDQNYNF